MSHLHVSLRTSLTVVASGSLREASASWQPNVVQVFCGKALGALMNHQLVTEEDFDTLPEHPERRFLALEQICRTRLYQQISQETSEHYDQTVRLQYMRMVSAAAEELNIPNLEISDNYQRPVDGFDDFLSDVVYVTTKLRLRTAGARDPHSVQLTTRTKGRIELQVRRLRAVIEASDLPDERKRNLLERLDELSAEMNKPRIKYGVMMAVIAALSIGVTQGTSFLADAPDAIATITALIGADKEAEDAEQARIGANQEVKSLPAPTKKSQIKPVFEPTSDDDIPF
jgi:hypothetical protein